MSSKLIVKDLKRCGPSPFRSKIRRRRSRFLPPQVDRQNSGRGLFGREEPKGGGQSGVIPNEILSGRLDFEPGVVFCRSRQGEPKCQTNRRLQCSTQNLPPTSLPHTFGKTKSRPINSRP